MNWTMSIKLWLSSFARNTSSPNLIEWWRKREKNTKNKSREWILCERAWKRNRKEINIQYQKVLLFFFSPVCCTQFNEFGRALWRLHHTHTKQRSFAFLHIKKKLCLTLILCAYLYYIFFFSFAPEKKTTLKWQTNACRTNGCERRGQEKKISGRREKKNLWKFLNEQI